MCYGRRRFAGKAKKRTAAQTALNLAGIDFLSKDHDGTWSIYRHINAQDESIDSGDNGYFMLSRPLQPLI